MQSDEWWWHLPPDTHNSSPGAHLFVCQHGLWGSPEDVSFLEQYLRHSGWLTLNAKSNSARCTFDGADVCGDRLAAEVVGHVKRLAATGVRVTHISFAAYSFGGLIARYAVGKLLASGFFRRVLPVNFLTIASPHLGCWEHPSSMSQLAFNSILPWTLSRTGRQLLLADRWLEPEGLPLLAAMARPDCTFHAALAAFRKRVLLADIRCDRTVPYTTAAITAINPYFPAPPRARGPRQGQTRGAGGDEGDAASAAIIEPASCSSSTERRALLVRAAGAAQTADPGLGDMDREGGEAGHHQRQLQRAELQPQHSQRHHSLGCRGGIREEGSEAEVREDGGSQCRDDHSSGLGGSGGGDHGAWTAPPAFGGLRSLLHWASWGLGGGEGWSLGSILFGGSGAGCSVAEEDDAVPVPCCCCCPTGECCSSSNVGGTVEHGGGEDEEGGVERFPAVIALPISSAYPCIVTPHPTPHLKHPHHPHHITAGPKPPHGLQLSTSTSASMSMPTSPRSSHGDTAAFPTPKPDRGRSAGSGTLPRPPSSAAAFQNSTVSATADYAVPTPHAVGPRGGTECRSQVVGAAVRGPTNTAATSASKRTMKCGASSDGGGVGASWLRRRLLGIRSRVGLEGGGVSDGGGVGATSTCTRYSQPHCPHCPLHVSVPESRWQRRGRGGAGATSRTTAAATTPGDTARCAALQQHSNSHPTTTQPPPPLLSRLSRHASSSSAMLPGASGGLLSTGRSGSSGYNYASRRASSGSVGEVRVGLRDAAGSGCGIVDVGSKENGEGGGGDEDVFSSRVRLGLFLMLLPVLLSLWLCMVAWLAGIWIHHYAILLTVRPDRSWNVRLGWPMMSSASSAESMSAAAEAGPVAAGAPSGEGAGSSDRGTSEAGGERMTAVVEQEAEEQQGQEQEQNAPIGKRTEATMVGDEDFRPQQNHEEEETEDVDLDAEWSEGPLVMRLTGMSAPHPPRPPPAATVRPQHICRTDVTAPSGPHVSATSIGSTAPLNSVATPIPSCIGTRAAELTEVPAGVHERVEGPLLVEQHTAAVKVGEVADRATTQSAVARTESQVECGDYDGAETAVQPIRRVRVPLDDQHAQYTATAEAAKLHCHATVGSAPPPHQSPGPTPTTDPSSRSESVLLHEGGNNGEAAESGARQEGEGACSSPPEVVVRLWVRSLFSALEQRQGPRGGTLIVAGDQVLGDEAEAVVRVAVRRIFRAVETARLASTAEAEVEGVMATTCALGNGTTGDVNLRHLASTPLPLPGTSTEVEDGEAGVVRAVVRRVFRRCTGVGGGLSGRPVRGCCVPSSHMEALDAERAGPVGDGDSEVGGFTPSGMEATKDVVRRVVRRAVLSVLRNGPVVEWASGTGLSTCGGDSRIHWSISTGGSSSGEGRELLEPASENARKVGNVVMGPSPRMSGSGDEEAVVAVRPTAAAGACTQECEDRSYIRALVRRIVMRSILTRQSGGGQDVGESGIGGSTSLQDVCRADTDGAVTVHHVGMNAAAACVTQGVEEGSCKEALSPAQRTPAPCAGMQPPPMKFPVTIPAPHPLAPQEVRERQSEATRTSQLHARQGPGAAQQGRLLSPSALQMSLCAQEPYDPAVLLADMIAQLNQLEWQKVDVDTRHYHAHAAIVVRSSRRFRSHAHIIEYAVRQLKM